MTSTFSIHFLHIYNPMLEESACQISPQNTLNFYFMTHYVCKFDYLESHSSFDNFYQNGRIENLLHITTDFARKLCHVHKYAWQILAKLVK